MSSKLSGIYPPIPTPFREDGAVDFDGITNNVTKWNETRLAGYVVLGSNGEAVLISKDEKLQVLRTVIESAAPGKDVVAGTGCESTRATIALTREAAEVGAVAALVMNPHFYPLSESVLEDYFAEVADASPIPLVIYNVPKFTGANLSAALVSKLATHPNIVGLKDSSGNLGQMSEIIRSSPPGFSVLSGTANVLYGACAMGGDGAVSALANVAPDQTVQLMEMVASQQHQRARDLQMRLLPVNVAVTSTYGVPGLKSAMSQCGYTGGYPRRPLKPLPRADEDELKRILEEAEIL